MAGGMVPDSEREGGMVPDSVRERGADIDGRRGVPAGTRDSNYPDVIYVISSPYLHREDLGIFCKGRQELVDIY